MQAESDPVPLYVQIQRQLRRDIGAGTYAPGDLLPTEAQICSSYGVSRITAGRALDGLEAAGLIVRRRGLGSFVADVPVLAKTVRLVGSLDETLAPVRNLKLTVHSREFVTAPPDIAKALRLAPREKPLLIQSLYATREGPFAWALVYLPNDIGRLLDGVDLDSGPVAHIVNQLSGEKVVRAEQSVDPATADTKLAARLGIPRRSPVLRVTRTFYRDGNRPVQANVAWYHPERYRYRVHLLPDAAG